MYIYMCVCVDVCTFICIIGVLADDIVLSMIYVFDVLWECCSQKYDISIYIYLCIYMYEHIHVYMGIGMCVCVVVVVCL